MDHAAIGESLIKESLLLDGEFLAGNPGGDLSRLGGSVVGGVNRSDCGLTGWCHF